MSTTQPRIEQLCACAPDAAGRVAEAARSTIDWPELKLPPINLYNVQRTSSYPTQASQHPRD